MKKRFWSNGSIIFAAVVLTGVGLNEMPLTDVAAAWFIFLCFFFLIRHLKNRTNLI